VTGTYEIPNVRESFVFAQKLVPSIRKVLMVTDKSLSGDQYFRYVRSLRDLPVEIVAYEQPDTFDQWKKLIENYESRVDAYGLFVMRSIKRSATDAEVVEESEVIEWLNHHSNRPSVGFFDVAAQMGLLCGISVSMKEQGYAAGKIARDLLEGHPIDSIQIEPTKRGRIQLNLREAERLGIEIDYNVIRLADELVK
jgi:ABC-type uncharacterized transport system substrate-binding protein